MSLNDKPVVLPTNQQGMALVLVLWMLVLLTTIANSLVFSSRSEILIANNLAQLAQAEALADAGFFKAIHMLQSAAVGQQAGAQSTVQVDPTRWRADGMTRSWGYRGSELLVTIIDETGKIDVNSAPPPLLQGLFRSVGVDEALSVSLVDAMLDWRDTDDLRRPHGAEKAEYASKGLPYGPANSDFESIDELRQVLGMNESIFNQIEPYITVHSGQGGINSSLAPRQVLLSIPGVSVEQVEQFIAQRQGLLEQGLPPPPFSAAQGFSVSQNTVTYSIHVEAVMGDNATFARQAVVRLSGPPTEPFAILDWRTLSVVDRTTSVAGVQPDVTRR